MPDPYSTDPHLSRPAVTGAHRRGLRLRSFVTATLLAVAGAVALPATSALAAATDYYVDCSASSNGNGSSGSPWNSLDGPNAATFTAGDRVLLKRGTTCSGRLTPGGSGSSSAVNTIDAYGTGARPVIDGGTGNDAAIKLFNQAYWDIKNVETKGGNKWGIYVSGNVSQVLQHIHISNVYVHDVHGTAADKETGGIIVEQGAEKHAFNDVVIDGATVHSTDQWTGIGVGTDDFQWTSDKRQNTASTPNTNVTIKNSTVYDTGGDGITVFRGTDVLITSNVAYETGTATKATVDKVGTPNGIWTWWCKRCTVEYNESYLSHSAGADGGTYDIDYWSDDNTVQYNYGHDADSYCYAIFGSEDNVATTNSVIRYNVCSNNGRNSSNGWQEDIALVSWGGGTLDGVEIYNNTHYWNPAGPGYPAVLDNAADKSGTRPWIVKNNIFYSTNPGMIEDRNGALTLNNNIYWTTSSTAPWWKVGETSRTFTQHQANGQDVNSLYADPKLNSPTSHSTGRPTTAFTLQSGSPAIDAGASLWPSGSSAKDFFGNSAPQGNGYDIGAHEFTQSTSNPVVLSDDFEDGNADGWTTTGGTWSVVQPPGHSKEYTRTSSDETISSRGSSSWTNYTVQSFVKLDSSDGAAGVMARMQANNKFYLLELGRDVTGSGAQIWGLWKNNGGSWTKLATGSYPFDTSTYYLLRLTVNGNTLTGAVSTNWGSSFNELGSATDSTFTSGYIGLRPRGAGATFDAVKVTSAS